ncbi:sulfite exporter TauE/SafE family protein [Ancylobacter mangrovi]|uniref:Probable membrane transporter protein n=1 Tax=Ancylobacter mangrovi TaxID=2972472 RepID=A0A9X2PBA6_9HYPH|nr:sulfite exporter TauE/SafE family protein [Ancylobacter mangrovi]MCS0494239.1 sulfite exporter TauE/SafE family protein [Ancylobacter mangrovi]MCS0501034.1 sulfite exporter TauE/SafE family protein [Ancylobacter mangrovi]
MTIYLPIAELPVNIFTLLAMGIAVGFVSGMFGVGGGFLMTPLLIFLGVPPPVAVASVSTHMAASSFSGTLNYMRRKLVDVQLGLVLLSGGMVGTLAGVLAFHVLRRFGQLDLVIAVAYVALLGTVGTLMIVESVRALLRQWRGVKAPLRRPGAHPWFLRMPFKMRFRQSRIYVSIIPVVTIGFSIGFLGSLMGVGGGFLLVPALIYLLRVPTITSVATSLLLTLVTMVSAIVLHSIFNQTVDAVLGLVLMVGGTIGAQFGARAGQSMKAENLRFLLGLLVLAVGLRVAYDQIARPAELYAVTIDESAR